MNNVYKNMLSFMNNCFFYLLKVTGVIVFKLLYNAHVKHETHIPKKGPLIVAANHFSYMDPAVLQTMFPRRINFMMTEIYYEGRARWLFKMLRCICIREKGSNITALREGVEVLKKNGVIGIFPEGSVSKEGRLQEGNPGIGFLVRKTGAPVIPAYISGTYEALPKGKIIPKISRIKIIFGSPMVFHTMHENIDKKDVVEITDQIMHKIQALSLCTK